MEKLTLKPLKGRKNFAALFNSGSRFSEKEVSAVIDFRQINSISGSDNNELTFEVFYALGVRKKVAKKAIIRNRLKRLMRESLKQIFKDSEGYELAEMFQTVYLSWNIAPSHHKLIGLNDVYPKIKDILIKSCKTGQRKGKRTENNSYNID